MRKKLYICTFESRTRPQGYTHIHKIHGFHVGFDRTIDAVTRRVFPLPSLGTEDASSQWSHAATATNPRGVCLCVWVEVCVRILRMCVSYTKCSQCQNLPPSAMNLQVTNFKVRTLGCQKKGWTGDIFLYCGIRCALGGNTWSRVLRHISPINRNRIKLLLWQSVWFIVGVGWWWAFFVVFLVCSCACG